MTPIPLGILASSGFGAAGSFELLQTIELSSDTSSITFSNLDQFSNFNHLQIRAYVSDNRVTAQNNNNIWVRFNGDTGSNYGWAYIATNGSGSSNNSTYTGGPSVNSPSGMIVYNSMSGAWDNKNYGSFMANILNFNSTERKIFSYYGGAYSPTEKNASVGSGTWSNTSPITSINLRPNADQFDDGSRFSLYGWAAA